MFWLTVNWFGGTGIREWESCQLWSKSDEHVMIRFVLVAVIKPIKMPWPDQLAYVWQVVDGGTDGGMRINTQGLNKRTDTWWCHDLEMLSALLALCVGNPPVTGGFPSQRTRNAEVWCVYFLFAISCWTNSPVASDFRCLNSHVTLLEWFWHTTVWNLLFWKEKFFLFGQFMPKPMMTQFTDLHCNMLPIEHKVIQNVLFGIYSKSCGSCVCCWSSTLMTKFGLCTSLGLPYERL